MQETRTECDLAEALVTLERYAPDPHAVLRGLRGHPRRRAARWRRPLILAAAASAAAATLVLALLTSAGTGPAGRPAPPGLPSATSVAKAMLTAFDSVSGDVEYETETVFHPGGVPVSVSRFWSWPAQPVPGQRLLSRLLFSLSSPASTAVKPIEDRGTEGIVPSRGQTAPLGQVTMVCFPGPGRTGCGWGSRDTLAGTWSRFTAPVGTGTDVSSNGVFDPAALAHGIATGAWRITGRTQLDGQQALELSEIDRGQNNNTWEPLPVRLWVNAQTYLPIRMSEGASAGREAWSVRDFRYLPPTPANLALLQVPIPAGYPRR